LEEASDHCGGEQRKYDGVDFTIVRSVRRRWHIYITKNKNIGDQPGAYLYTALMLRHKMAHKYWY
jgi:hypothetical protein